MYVKKGTDLVQKRRQEVFTLYELVLQKNLGLWKGGMFTVVESDRKLFETQMINALK